MTDPKPKRTGTIHRYAPAKPGETYGHFVVRCTAPDGSRPTIPLDPSPNTPEARELAKRTAQAIAEQIWREGLGSAPPRKRQSSDPVEAEAWFTDWLEDRVQRGLTSTRDNEAHYREHIVPILGPIHVKDWTQEDLRLLVNALDDKVRAGDIAWKTACNIWGTATRMCKDAFSSKRDTLRVRQDNPAVGVLGPDRGARTVKQYLWPSEFLHFVSCPEVPCQWRRVVALAVYLYPRAGELRKLRWEDIDLEHGTVHIHRATDRVTKLEKSTKTGVARRFNIERELIPLLRTMHDESGGNGLVVELPSERDLARGLRRWLKRAGIEREELFEPTRTRKAITFHDTRSTGITWMAVRGDDPLKIQQRAGHTDFTTTQGYIREAEAIREGFGEVFPALPRIESRGAVTASVTRGV